MTCILLIAANLRRISSFEALQSATRLASFSWLCTLNNELIAISPLNFHFAQKMITNCVRSCNMFFGAYKLQHAFQIVSVVIMIFVVLILEEGTFVCNQSPGISSIGA